MAGIKVCCDFGKDVDQDISANLNKALSEQGYEVLGGMFERKYRNDSGYGF